MEKKSIWSALSSLDPLINNLIDHKKLYDDDN